MARASQRPVRRLVGEPHPVGQGAELAVWDLVAHQPASQGAGVDPAVGQRCPPRVGQRRLQEPQVEPDVVAHDHGRAQELEERRQDRLDPRRATDHGVGDARQHGDLRGDAHARVDQRLERAQALTAPHLHGADLGDGAVGRGGTGCLDVEDAEGDLAQRRAEIVE